MQDKECQFALFLLLYLFAMQDFSATSIFSDFTIFYSKHLLKFQSTNVLREDFHVILEWMFLSHLNMVFPNPRPPKKPTKKQANSIKFLFDALRFLSRLVNMLVIAKVHIEVDKVKWLLCAFLRAGRLRAVSGQHKLSFGKCQATLISYLIILP